MRTATHRLPGLTLTDITLDAPLDDVRPSSPEIVATAWFMPHELPELQPETATALVALSRSGRIDLTGSGLTPSSARPTR